MTDLQKHMDETGLQKADMARLFGVTWQTFHNWMDRGSLPKRHWARAEEILNGREFSEIVLLLRQLSPEGLKAALKSIDAICVLEQRSDEAH